MTHINAFYADIEDKNLKVERAKGELEAAKEALKAHPDYKGPKKVVEELKEEKSDPLLKVKKSK